MATHTAAAVIIFLCLPQAFNLQGIRKWQDRELQEFRAARASELLRYLNKSVNPCDDFYEFACGKWAKSHPVSKEKPITSPLESVKDKVYSQLHPLLQEVVTIRDKVADRQMKDFYASCMDSRNAAQSIRAVFRNFTKQHRGHGMPAIDSSWNETLYNWLEHIAELRLEFGIDMLIGVDVKLDTQPSRGNALYLIEPSTILPKPPCAQGRLSDQLFNKMQKHIVDNMRYWFDMSEGDAKRLAKELMDFEIEICRGMDGDLFSTRLFLAAANQRFPAIDFNYFVSTIFKHATVPDPVNLNERYYYNLAGVVATAPRRTIANYIMYRFLDAISFPDETNVEKRSRLCIDKVMLFFPNAVGYLYERNFNRPEIRDDVESIWDKLTSAFLQDIRTQLWIPETYRRLMTYKLSDTRLQFPVYSFDDLTHEYEPITISRDDFWNNMQFLMRHMQERQTQKIHFGTNGTHVEFNDAADTKIVYSDKIIQVPLGLLQSPIYDWIVPVGIKYGTLGFLMAHEAVRGIIQSAWDTTTTQTYKFKLKCFHDQYLNYLVHTPLVTTSELDDILKGIVADSSAVNISFHAYLKWLSEAKERPILLNETFTDVDYTNTQLFFITFAQSLCTAKYTDRQQTSLSPWAAPNRHEQFRVNGPLSNNREFAQEFNCEKGTEMNPPGKCIVF